MSRMKTTDVFTALCYIAAPSLDETIRTQTVTLGDHHKMKFNINGTGPFDYKIYRNNQLLSQSDKRVRLSMIDSQAKLNINGRRPKPTPIS